LTSNQISRENVIDENRSLEKHPSFRASCTRFILGQINILIGLAAILYTRSAQNVEKKTAVIVANRLHLLFSLPTAWIPGTPDGIYFKSTSGRSVTLNVMAKVT